MKLMQCFLIFILAIPTISFAQDLIDVSSPEDPLVAPAIVVKQTSVEPTCHSYTGCSVVIVREYRIHHYYKVKRHYKAKQHCAYYLEC